MKTTSVNINSKADFQRTKIQKVAQEFESLFTSMMLRSMRKTIGENPLMPESLGDKIYTEMLDNEYTKISGKKGTFGLAKLVEKELERQGTTKVYESFQSGSNNNFWMIDNAFTSQELPKESSKPYNSVNQFKIDNWKELINEASETHGVDKNLITAVIYQESGGNPFAVSKAGAKGLMQLMDTTAADLGVENSFSPRSNIMGGTKYLKSLLEKFNGNELLALASYNAGPASVDKYKGVPPFIETQKYVKSVLDLKQHFANKE